MTNCSIKLYIFIFPLTLLVSILWKRNNTTQRTGWPSFSAIVPIGVECSQQRQWRRPHNQKIMVADFYIYLTFSLSYFCKWISGLTRVIMERTSLIELWVGRITYQPFTTTLSLLHAPLLTTNPTLSLSARHVRGIGKKCLISVALENCEIPDLVENERW